MKCVRVQVSGTVQGVFFRDTVSHAADERGVAGWVRNCSDGRVEAVLEGADDAVDSVVEVCRNGSEPARVQEVSVSVEEPAGLTGFEVR
ncbi:MAG: acylphosphatase [Thermoleophilaceae bacterium]